MNVQRPSQRFDRDRLLTVISLTVSAGYGLLAVAHLLLQIIGGRG